MITADKKRSERIAELDQRIKDNENSLKETSQRLLDLGFTEIEEGSYKNCCNGTERNVNYQCDDNDNEKTSIADLLKYVDGDYETYESVEDMINEPPHYATRHIQPNDYIDDLLVWNTALTPREGYCVGQIHRYLGRAGMKEGNEKMQDFKKAQYYMNRMIEKEG